MSAQRWQIAGAIWFGVSVLALIVARFVFWIWLTKRGARVSWFWAATPGYLEKVYVDWCRETGRPTGMWIFWSWALLINALASIFVYIFVVVPTFPRVTGHGLRPPQ
jgi:hypothetical protein